MPRPPGDRPQIIGEAALAVIAERGMRGLTHRAVDAEAHVPAGTTSNHARTRHELIELALARLADHFRSYPSHEDLPQHLTDDAVVDFVTASVEHAIELETDQVAYLTLRLDLRADDELRPLIDSTSRAERTVLSLTSAVMARLGVHEPEARAAELLAVLDGVVLAHVAGGRAVDVRTVVATYLAGIRRLDAGAEAAPSSSDAGG